MKTHAFALISALMIWAGPSAAQAQEIDYAAQVKEGSVVLEDFHFKTGESLERLKLHYITLGAPHRDENGEIDNAVMIVHGTGGSGRQFLAPQFAQELYGPGQPLDINRYFIILPDSIGHGGSSKPSDGLRMKFPKYVYDDMVEAQKRMLAEGLGVSRLRLMMGTSMGCMHSFIWGEKYPDAVQAFMPLACLPVEIAGHNRMWRRAAMEGVMQDPAWRNGDYREQPVMGLRTAVSLLHVAGFAPLYLQKHYNTREKAESYILPRIANDIPNRDANDLLYQLDSSRDYNPWKDLEKIKAPMTWVNSSDDFVNPWNYGIAEKAAARMPNTRYVLIQATEETRGHSTHTYARFWKQELVDLLARSGNK